MSLVDDAATGVVFWDWRTELSMLCRASDSTALALAGSGASEVECDALTVRIDSMAGCEGVLSAGFEGEGESEVG